MKVSDQLRKSILQAAIQGKLTEQLESDGSAYDLLEEIRAKKEQLIKDKKIKKEKPLAPITDEEIPFDIPENWEWARLGQAILLVSGRDLETREFNDSKDGIPYMTGASNFINGVLEINRWTMNPKVLSTYGDLLITVKGTIGEISYNTIGDIHIARQIMAIRNIYNLEIDYIKFFLQYYISELQSLARSMIPGISRENILDAIIPLPPLAEQQRIVEKIEELLPELDKLKEQEEIASKADTELPEKLRKSFLQAAMQGKLTEQLESDGTAYDLLEQIKTEKEQLIKDKKIKKEKTLLPITDEEIPFDIPENWSWVRLGNVLNIFTGNSISVSVKTQKYMKDIEGYPYIATKDVSFEKTINYDNGVIIPFDENRFNVVKVRTPLLCIEGGSAGRKIGFTNQQVCFGNKLCAFEAYSQLIDSKYVFYFLQSPEFINQFSESINGIIGGVGTTKLKSFIISIPPVLEQKRIVEKLDILFDKVDLLQ